MVDNMNVPTLDNKKARFQELVNKLDTPEHIEQAFEALKQAKADFWMLGMVSKRLEEIQA